MKISKPLPVTKNQILESINTQTKYHRLTEEEEAKLSDEDIKVAKEIADKAKAAADDVVDIMNNIEIEGLSEDDLKAMAENLGYAPATKKMVLESIENKNYKLNEGGLMGLILSSPKILEIIGWSLDKLGNLLNIVVKKVSGKTMDKNVFNKIGEMMKHAGHEAHHFMLKMIQETIGAVVKTVTGGKVKLDDKQKEKFAKLVMFGLIAYLFVTGAPDVIKKILDLDPSAAWSALLQGIKGGELLETSKLEKAISKIVASIMVVFGFKAASEALPDKKDELEGALQNVKIA